MIVGRNIGRGCGLVLIEDALYIGKRCGVRLPAKARHRLGRQNLGTMLTPIGHQRTFGPDFEAVVPKAAPRHSNRSARIVRVRWLPMFEEA